MCGKKPSGDIADKIQGKGIGEENQKDVVRDSWRQTAAKPRRAMSLSHTEARTGVLGWAESRKGWAKRRGELEF